MTIAEVISALISAVVSFIAGLFVERYRQKHGSKGEHFEKIKSVVFAYIQDQLVDHYLRVVDGHEGALTFLTLPLRGAEVSSTEHPQVHYKFVLGPKPPQLSIVSSLGSSLDLQRHEETYPHLYDDVKQNHFPESLERFERVVAKYENVCRCCTELTKQFSQKLEQSINLPARVANAPQETWVNYPLLSLFIYERLWGVSCGALSISEQAGKYNLDWPHRMQCGRGPRDEIERCRRVVDELLKTEKDSVETIRKDAQCLRPELQAIRIELEKISIQRKLPGNCDFI
jgi:hypothetical protein